MPPGSPLSYLSYFIPEFYDFSKTFTTTNQPPFLRKQRISQGLFCIPIADQTLFSLIKKDRRFLPIFSSAISPGKTKQEHHRL